MFNKFLIWICNLKIAYPYFIHSLDAQILALPPRKSVQLENSGPCAVVAVSACRSCFFGWKKLQEVDLQDKLLPPGSSEFSLQIFPWKSCETFSPAAKPTVNSCFFFWWLALVSAVSVCGWWVNSCFSWHLSQLGLFTDSYQHHWQTIGPGKRTSLNISRAFHLCIAGLDLSLLTHRHVEWRLGDLALLPGVRWHLVGVPASRVKTCCFGNDVVGWKQLPWPEHRGFWVQNIAMFKPLKLVGLLHVVQSVPRNSTDIGASAALATGWLCMCTEKRRNHSSKRQKKSMLKYLFTTLGNRTKEESEQFTTKCSLRHLQRTAPGGPLFLSRLMAHSAHPACVGFHRVVACCWHVPHKAWKKHAGNGAVAGKESPYPRLWIDQWLSEWHMSGSRISFCVLFVDW